MRKLAPNYSQEVNKFDDVFIFLLVIFSVNFFSAKFALTDGVFKYIGFSYLLGAILLSARYFLMPNVGFVLPVKMICLSIIFSIFMSYISWGQSLSYGISTIPYAVWFVFFYLLYKKYPIERLEKILIFYGVVYIILYFFQFVNSNVVYFGYKEEFVEDRGIIRIDFPGGGLFYLSYFIALTKCLDKSKMQFFFILFVFVSIIVVILQVTRQSIALISIITLFHFFKNVSLRNKILVFTSFCMAVALFFIVENPVSKGLIETQKETAQEGSKYIRVLAGEYFLRDFSPNILSRIFGNGFPNNNSDYGKFTVKLSDTYGYYLSDVGLIGFYALFGIFPIIAYCIIYVRGLLLKVPAKYIYLKYHLVFILFTGVTSDYVYSINYIFANVVVFYCLHLIYEHQKIIDLTGFQPK